MDIEPGKVTDLSESALVRFDTLDEHRRFARYAPPLLLNTEFLRISLGIRKPEDYPITREIRVETLGKVAGRLMVYGYGAETQRMRPEADILRIITGYLASPRLDKSVVSLEN